MAPSCRTQEEGLSRNKPPVLTEAMPQALCVDEQVGHAGSQGEGWVVGGWGEQGYCVP